jgi:hypothetical protein
MKQVNLSQAVAQRLMSLISNHGLTGFKESHCYRRKRYSILFLGRIDRMFMMHKSGIK